MSLLFVFISIIISINKNIRTQHCLFSPSTFLVIAFQSTHSCCNAMKNFSIVISLRKILFYNVYHIILVVECCVVKLERHSLVKHNRKKNNKNKHKTVKRKNDNIRVI